MAIYKSVSDLIGNTPLVELSKLEKELGLKARILAKLESFNPAGSVKDRIAKSIILDAEKSGRLQPGATIYEPTSGNTGIGIAMVGRAHGYKVVIVMPDTMSVERRNMIHAYGAEIVLTPGKDGMKGAIAKAQELHEKDPGSIIAGQFDNPANPQAHYETTGPEIWRDTEGVVDYFVAGVGTGGTLTGTGRYLKEKNPNVKAVAVEPTTSPVLSGGKPGPHKIQGIGAGFIPKTLGVIYNSSEVNSEVQVNALKTVAQKMGVTLKIATVSNVNDIQQAANSLVGKVQAIYIPTDNVLASAMPTLIKVTNQAKLPVICGEPNMVKNGGLATIGIDYYELGKIAGDMGADILDGKSKPENMAIRYQQQFKAMVNAKTAKEIGIQIPDSVKSKAEIIQ